MTLYFIGIGLASVKDISVRGLEIVKNCSFVYLENYTSILQNSAFELEEFYGKSVILADRDLVEKKADEMIDKAKEEDVAFLVVGDPMCATTHVDLRTRAKKKGVKVIVVHNASIISAVGVLGLEVYKYGKVTSIPFHNSNVKAPVGVYNMNNANGLHTLFLLDLDPKNRKYLSVKEAAEYLISNGLKEDTIAIGCARIGAEDQVVKVGKLSSIGSYEYGNAPYCIVIPGGMHFMESDALKEWE